MLNRQQGKQFVLIQSNRVKSTTFLTHPTLSRGAIFIYLFIYLLNFAKHALRLHCANRLPACQIDSRETIHGDLIESTTFSTDPQGPNLLYFLSVMQIDFQHVESTEGEMIHVDSME